MKLMPLRRARRRQLGFTMIELMVVVVILVVVLSAVAPSMRSFIEGQQVKALAFDLTTDLLLARSEALKRNGSVTVTRGATWSSGWTTAAAAAPATPISVHNATAYSVNISADAPAAITFDLYGRVSSPTSDVRITLSAGGATRCVELDVSGRARSSRGACT